MRKLRIGFSKNAEGKVFSVILQKYMNRDYSHTFIEYDTVKHMGDYAIYHSSLSSGVGFANKTIFEEHNEIVAMYEIELCEESYDLVRRNLFGVCGRKYGLMQNLGVAVVDLLKKIGIKIANPFKKNENCSELVFRHAIAKVHPQLLDIYDPDSIKPSDVEELLKAIGTKVL